MLLPLDIFYHLYSNINTYFELVKHFSYCKFRDFGENFIFVNSVKRHICEVKNTQLRHDLPASVNDRVILPFREGYIFTYAKFHEIKTLAKIFEFTVS